MRSKIVGLGIVCATLAAVAPGTAAAESRGSFTPYLWMSAVDANVGVGPVDSSLDMSFSDILDDLDAAFIGHLEIGQGAWSGFADFIYMSMSPEAEIGPVKFNTKLKNRIAEAGAAYALSDSGSSRFELLGGVRYMSMETNISLPGAPAGGATVLDETLTDFFAGVRLANKLSDRWTLRMRADVGTGSSDLVWHATAMLDYAFSRSLSGLIGYKVLDYDYEDGTGAGRRKIDMTMDGPALALTFSW